MSHATKVKALASGEGFADLSFWRKVAVSGSDAYAWLNDLVSADISELGPGHARRSLLLSPTGRIRAEFTVAASGGSLLLLQDPAQPAAIDALLAPYTLSSDVDLQDRTGEMALFAFPGRSTAPDVPATAVWTPSCVGEGVDLLCAAEIHESLLASLSVANMLADGPALEAWRVMAGIPRFGFDATEEDLPQDAGLAGAVSFEKGCYLGQETVAKVRNLGHPRRLMLHLEAAGPVSAGEAVEREGARVGEVTSCAHTGGRRRLLAKVRWDSREGPFRTAGGVNLIPVTRAGPAVPVGPTG